jgi:hypothetical protein
MKTASAIADASWAQGLWKRFEAHAERLDRARASDRALPPASQWIADNLHVAEEALQAVASEADEAQLARLPLASDRGRAQPRVQRAIAEHLSAARHHLDVGALAEHLRGRSEAQPLALAELRAVVYFLRVELLEQLAAIAADIEVELDAEAAADALADELLELDAWPAALRSARRSSRISCTGCVITAAPRPARWRR